MRRWKIYSLIRFFLIHAEIIQTPDIVIAIDLIEGFDLVKWDRTAMKNLVGGIDALLVTHSHADHADWNVMDMFLDGGKPVIAPERFANGYRRGAELTVIREGKFDLPGAAVTVFPSFQKKDIDSVYLIRTAEGITVMHTGDENEIMYVGNEWYRRFRKPLEVDVLIPNIWCPNIKQLLKHVKPKLVLSSHEHEIGHPVEGRRSYDYVYSVLRAINLPYVVPAWGEPVRYPPDLH